MGRALPMAEIRITQISAQISNWSAKRLELEVNAALLVEYFNSSIMAFEPLIEKWPLCLTLQVIPYTFNALMLTYMSYFSNPIIPSLLWELNPKECSI